MTLRAAARQGNWLPRHCWRQGFAGLSVAASAPLCRECPCLLLAALAALQALVPTAHAALRRAPQGWQALTPARTYTQTFMEQILSPQTMIINSGVKECRGSALPLLESQKCWKTSRTTCAGNLHDPSPHSPWLWALVSYQPHHHSPAS